MWRGKSQGRYRTPLAISENFTGDQPKGADSSHLRLLHLSTGEGEYVALTY